MVRGIAGLEKLSGGSIELDGEDLKIRSVTEAIQKGIAYITEDRKTLGLYLNFSITSNLIAPSLDRFCRAGMMLGRSIDTFAREQIQRFNVKSTSLDQKMMSLSGGNQQKCLLSMWMGTSPKVLIFDEPTRGVDVGARSEIYEKIREYTLGGGGHRRVVGPARAPGHQRSDHRHVPRQGPQRAVEGRGFQRRGSSRLASGLN